MKAKKIEAKVFRPITLQIEVSTEYELEMLKHTVESMAPVDSTPASLNQKQYDFACTILILLRNAANDTASTEHETEIKW